MQVYKNRSFFLALAIAVSLGVVAASESPLIRFTSQARQASQAENIRVDRNNGPDSTRFSHSTLISGFDEPMQMAILPNYDVVVVERKGAVRYFNNSTRELSTIAQFNVFSGIEDGLLGVAADPAYEKNHWIYFYYAVAGEKNISELARYELTGGKLQLASKKVLLTVPTQRSYCCHSAGHVTFGSDGLLYLSIGDNTNAEEIEGHNPIDERPGRELSDGQASTANSNDLRGKILRIRPEPDGTYSIPDGNLFPKDGSAGRPEIFAMGLRNPFRVSVDPKTQYVYWGDVGPDTQVKTEDGKLSYDEINQARKPGFFGYPYFLGNNVAFPDYDFATKQEGPGKDPLRPYNDSPNNTGIKMLPPAQPAFIWYGKGPSKKWPVLGSGGASAMAGPVYYSDLYPAAPYKLPEYYNGKLFIYDWIRKWIIAVEMDADGNYVSMERFLPQLRVVAPIDMQIASDGAIYLLAYGTNWFARNTDSGIIRVEYSEGNRKPLASIKVDKTIGATPLNVLLSAAGSRDYDQGDILSYKWKVGNTSLSGKEIRHSFTKPGTYNVLLTVTDQTGAKGNAAVQVKVGNTPPVVNIETTGNKSFYWDNVALNYKIRISDREDVKVSNANIKASFTYLPFGKDLANAFAGGQESDPSFAGTAKLYASLDCKSCHSPDVKSIGPSLKDISARYKGQGNVAGVLGRKIIAGGSGSWGTYPMPPHANLTEKEAEDIAEYILSFGKQKTSLALSGEIPLKEHIGKGTEGAYILQATYTDNGANGIEPLTTRDHLVLRNPWIQMEDYHQGNVGVVIATRNTGFVSYIANITNGKFTSYKDIDLKGVKSIRLRVRAQSAGGSVEARQGSKTGILAGQLQIPAAQVPQSNEWIEVSLPLNGGAIKPGLHELFLIYRNDQVKGQLFHIDWMKFENE
ncbi:PQQ-dependent sugar dehydrogenase [Daejeonella sp. JGW-45]|uniref:PQQ-dependent sugar dehydrogenase n=1 Tax=Daejeonella sp. JGW-45 TaxID=3034148 RepID=UPI0023EBA491|nr:PQQ-dependent sugar dehydrogenase [Daejeonella sp. JGW-45]